MAFAQSSPSPSHCFTDSVWSMHSLLLSCHGFGRKVNQNSRSEASALGRESKLRSHDTLSSYFVIAHIARLSLNVLHNMVLNSGSEGGRRNSITGISIYQGLSNPSKDIMRE